MYIADMYIGGLYMRGDRISDNTPEDKIKWWLEAGAIHEASASELSAFDRKIKKEELIAAAEEPEIEDAEVEEDAETEEAYDEEADEEMEAPEIDVMAGIVQEEEAEKPKKTTRKKAEGRKSK